MSKTTYLWSGRGVVHTQNPDTPFRFYTLCKRTVPNEVYPDRVEVTLAKAGECKLCRARSKKSPVPGAGEVASKRPLWMVSCITVIAAKTPTRVNVYSGDLQIMCMWAGVNGPITVFELHTPWPFDTLRAEAIIDGLRVNVGNLCYDRGALRITVPEQGGAA